MPSKMNLRERMSQKQKERKSSTHKKSSHRKSSNGNRKKVGPSGRMGTDGKKHAEPVPASQTEKHPRVSVSFYRCRRVADHEERDMQKVASRVTRSSAPFQVVEQGEGDSKISLVSIMDDPSKAEAEAFAIRIGLEPEIFENEAGQFEQYVCKVEIKLGGVNIAAPIASTLAQPYFILYGGEYMWVDGVTLPDTMGAIRQFVSAEPWNKNPDKPSVAKIFWGTRDEYDEFEFEARMGHRIDQTSLKQRPTGGFQVIVRNISVSDRRTYVVGGFTSESLVEELRRYIQAKDGVGYAMRLKCLGKYLDDGNTLGSYGIKEDTFIEVLHPSAKGGGPASEQPVVEAGGYIWQPPTRDPGTHSWASEPTLKSRYRVVSTEYLKKHLGVTPPPLPKLPDMPYSESVNPWAEKVLTKASRKLSSRADIRNPKNSEVWGD